MNQLKANLPAIVLLICEIIFGVMLIINPIGLTTVILRAIGFGMIVGGIVWIIRYFRTEKTAAAISGLMFEGIICLLAGLFLFFMTNWIITGLSVVIVIYGIIILLIGVLKLQWTVDLLRFKRERWFISGLSALVAIVFGAIIILNPFDTQATLWRLAGIALVAQAVIDLVAVFACPRVIPKEEKGAVIDGKAREAGEKVNDLTALTTDLIGKICNDTDNALSVEEIASERGIDSDIVQKVVRMYVNHPGVTPEEIMDKLGL